MTINRNLIQLVIRGRVKPRVLEECRNLHNQTAGNPQGVAGARALGDLSHNVYVPFGDEPTVASELLFLDTWTNIEGMQKFFSDPQVQAGGGMMFESRDPVPCVAAGVYGCILPAPKDRTQRFVGLIRGTVKSRDAANAVLDKMGEMTNPLRQLGLVSHQMFYAAAAPSDAPELFGIDVWHDAEGMQKAYANKEAGAALYGLFTTTPASSMWKQPPGQWVEW